MIANRLRPAPSRRCYHLWPHGARVLDLGDHIHAASHLDDFAAHDYALRPVRLRDAGALEVVAYYDGQRQSALTCEQRSLVRAWVRQHAAPAHAASTDASFWTSYVAAPVAPATGHVVAAAAASQSARAPRVRWVALATVPAGLALSLIGYAVGLHARAPGVGATMLTSSASMLALLSAVIAWRQQPVRDSRHGTRSQSAVQPSTRWSPSTTRAERV